MGANLRNHIVILWLCLIVAACAGTAFVRQPDASLALGRTTVQEIDQRLGAPFESGAMTRNGKQIVARSYAFGSPSGLGAVAPDVRPARIQAFYFFEDRLVGYEFVSSWQEDHTDFDTANISKIKKGASTRADVAKLMGPPQGKWAYPLLPGSEDQADVFVYSQNAGWAFAPRRYLKRLVVTCDRRGVVTDVAYTESGER